MSKYARAISRQRFGKHVSAAADTHATIEVLLETMFSIRCKGVIWRTTEARIAQLEGSRHSQSRGKPLLEAVTRKRLVKTLRDAKDSVIL
jgi:hypothetical protein